MLAPVTLGLFSINLSMVKNLMVVQRGLFCHRAGLSGGLEGVGDALDECLSSHGVH